MLTQAQQEIRAQGIGGSEIAALAGLSPWTRPIDVYARKLKLVEDLAGDAPHIQCGIFLEPAIRAWYAHRTGLEVVEPGTLVHPKRPVVIATPDGIADPNGKRGGPRILEIKAPHWSSSAHWGQPGTDEVPEYYLVQVVWEMAAAGLHTSDVVPLMHGDIHIYHVHYNHDLFEALAEIAERFWRDHVLKQQPPPIDASDSTREWLRRQYPRAVSNLLRADAAAEQWVLKYKEACEALDKAEADKQLARNHLEALIGDHEGIEGPWGRILYRNNKDSLSIDFKALVEHLDPDPELIKQFTRIKPGPRVFRAKFNNKG